jgi:hypothetical protein
MVASKFRRLNTVNYKNEDEPPDAVSKFLTVQMGCAKGRNMAGIEEVACLWIRH